MFRKYITNSPGTELLPSRAAYQFVRYGHILVGWRSVGIRQPYKTLYLLCAILATIYSVCMPIGLVISYVREFRNFTPSELITSAQLIFNIPSGLIKSAAFFLNLWRVEQAEEQLDEMDKRCVRLDERQQVHRAVVRCNMMYLILFSMYNMYPISTISVAMLKGVPPWNAYNPFINWRDGTKELWISAILEFFPVLLMIYFNHAADIYPLVYGFMMRQHISLLRQRVDRLRQDESKSEQENYMELTACIKDHKLIMKHCNLMRSLISFTIFCQFLVIGVLLGLCLTNLFFFADLMSGIATVIYFCGCASQTFPFCYLCNMLEESGHDLTLAIFESNWIGATPRYKSSLVYFLHQSQRTIQFTAGSIFPISLNTNIRLAKFAFSVVTIVQQLDLAEKLKQ